MSKKSKHLPLNLCKISSMRNVNQKSCRRENGKTLTFQVHVDLLGLILKPRPAENLLTGEHWLQQHIQKSTRNTYSFPTKDVPPPCVKFVHKIISLIRNYNPLKNFQIISSQKTSKIFVHELLWTLFVNFSKRWIQWTSRSNMLEPYRVVHHPQIHRNSK